MLTKYKQGAINPMTKATSSSKYLFTLVFILLAITLDHFIVTGCMKVHSHSAWGTLSRRAAIKRVYLCRHDRLLY